jgi:hypothetical protein
MKLCRLIVFSGIAFVLSCAHSDSEIRFSCLKQAHSTVKVPEGDSKNREGMVRELYLRCLEAHGTPDAPI